MPASNKDTIYVDIDDEITGIIDKVRNSDSKVVALVLPKRAGVFQSIVNMKLLKRAAEADKKNLVLITSEAGLLPLAGAAGIHVAKTLTSKPEIPAGPDTPIEEDEAIDEDELTPDEDAPLDETKPVGELAKAGAVGAGAAAAADGVETLVMDDDDIAPEDAEAVSPSGKKFEPPKGKKDKKLKVPNFERFRLWLILGGAVLVLLIIGLVFANASLAKATITIKTDSTNVNVNSDLNLSTTAKKVSGTTLPAKQVSQQKTYTEQVPTTGQKNNGNKASGTVNLKNCVDRDGSITLPAGSSMTSGGNTFITQEAVTLDESTWNGSHSQCKSTPSATVHILAQSAGTAFNGATSFTAGSPYSAITGIGSTSGGTDSIVQSVNQNDINNAKAKISAASDASMKQTLKSQLQTQHYYALESTYQAGAPNVTTSSSVGEVANNVTVTEVITYTMFGVQQDDLEDLIKDNVKTQIDTDKQSILDTGLAKAVFNVSDISATGAAMTISTKAQAGPDLNTDDIKQAAMGKRAGAIKSDLSSNPDVTDVEVKFSPFWVSTVPKKADRITVHIAEPTTTKTSNQSDSR